MNKELFAQIRALALPVGQYAIFGSGPMGIRDLKECSDIDIIVSESLWGIFKNSPGWNLKVSSSGGEYLSKDDIEIWKDWKPWYRDVMPLIKEAEMINGLAFVRLERVIEWKRIFGREKDLKDVQAINKYLERGQ